MVHISWTISRRDSMFSVIRIGPAAGARKLCDIDKGVFGVTKSLVRNFESSCMTDQNYEVILLD